MKTLAEIRQKYPEYNEISDNELADALHKKYYPDMKKGDFYRKLGMQMPIPTVDLANKTAENDSAGTNLLSGIGKGMHSLYLGGKQALGLADEKEVDTYKPFNEGLTNQGMGLTGDILGQISAAAPAMFIPGVNSWTGSALFGGALGGLQPRGTNDSLATNLMLGLTGGVLGKFGGDKLGKMLAGNPNATLNEAEKKALEEGYKLGMKQTPGYASGSKGLQRLEAALESSPFFSRAFDNIKSHNQRIMNTVAGKELGEVTDSLNSEVLGKVHHKISQVYKNVADDTPRIIDADDTLTKLVGLADEYENMLPTDLIDNKLIAEFVKLAEKGQATGKQLQHLSSRIGRTAKNNMTSQGGDRELGKVLFQFKEIVDDHLQQGLNDASLEAFKTARQQYRKLMQLTSRNNILNSATGDVKGGALANFLQKTDRPGYLFGGNQSDLYNAARFHQAFKPIVGDSGTATRNLGNLDAYSLLGSLLTVPAAKAYTSPLVTKTTGNLMQNGLMHLPQQSLPHLERLGLLLGTNVGVNSANR